MKRYLTLLVFIFLPISISKADEGQMIVDPWQVIEHADSIDIVSIQFGKRTSEFPDFHGYNELGRVTVTERSVRAAIMTSFKKWNTHLHFNEESKMCFVPRHAIHAVLEDVTVDLLICFECSDFKIIITVKDPNQLESVLNKTLLDGRVQLAPKSVTSIQKADPKETNENEQP